MTLIDEQLVREYLDNATVCPFCKTEDSISWTGVRDSIVDRMYNRVRCASCGKEWEDVYVFAGIYAEGCEVVFEVKTN